MNTLADLLNLVLTTLQSRPDCRSARVLETMQFSQRQFALKVRAELANGGTLQVRLYRNGEHLVSASLSRRLRSPRAFLSLWRPHA